MTTRTRYALIAGALFLSLTGLAWWAYHRFFRDGIGPTGHWDDEGGFDDPAVPPAPAIELTYDQVQIPLRHFQIREFDSPDAPGSGGAMKIRFLQMLDEAREQAGIPFIVNSGYRTPAHNAAVGGVPNSAHLHGWAADISARTPAQKTRILQAARAAGFQPLRYLRHLYSSGL